MQHFRQLVAASGVPAENQNCPETCPLDVLLPGPPAGRRGQLAPEVACQRPHLAVEVAAAAAVQAGVAAEAEAGAGVEAPDLAPADQVASLVGVGAVAAAQVAAALAVGQGPASRSYPELLLAMSGSAASLKTRPWPVQTGVPVHPPAHQGFQDLVGPAAPDPGFADSGSR